MSFSSLLNQRCTIQKNHKTQDASGQLTKCWADKYEDIPCSVRKKTMKEAKGDLSNYDEGGYVMYIEEKYDITTSDRIVFNENNYKIDRAEKDSRLHHYELEISIIL